MTITEKKKLNALPDYFKPILWSYDFNVINPQKARKTIIMQAINYGDLRHWRWIIKYYGKRAVRKTLKTVPAREIKSRTRRLAADIFGIKKFNYAHRGA